MMTLGSGFVGLAGVRRATDAQSGSGAVSARRPLGHGVSTAHTRDARLRGHARPGTLAHNSEPARPLTQSQPSGQEKRSFRYAMV